MSFGKAWRSGTAPVRCPMIPGPPAASRPRTQFRTSLLMDCTNSTLFSLNQDSTLDIPDSRAKGRIPESRGTDSRVRGRRETTRRNGATAEQRESIDPAFGHVEGVMAFGGVVLRGPEQPDGERGLICRPDNRARLRIPLCLEGKRAGAFFGQNETDGIGFDAVSAPMTHCFRSGRSVLEYAQLIIFSGK